VWTSHPWLLWSYLNNETGHVTAEQIENLDRAILQGDVIWHANPMNMQFEAVEPSHMAEQLELSARLRERYNFSSDNTVGTVAASNKDEPGATLGLVGMLASKGVHFMHVGVNDFSTVPAVPSSSAHFHGYCNTFVWQDNETSMCGTTDGLRSDSCEIITAMCSGYSKSFNLGHQVPSMGIVLPGMTDALVLLMQVDNRGPPTVDQVLQGWADTATVFPSAELVSSSLDEFAQLLVQKRHLDRRKMLHKKWHGHKHTGDWSIPVVQNAELGSTWIFGVSSDPTKLSYYRAAARVRAEEVAENPTIASDPQFMEFSRLLLKIPEHTAGTSGDGCTVAPFKTGALGNVCEPGSSNYDNARVSYLDQRNYVWKAVQTLGDSADGWRVLPNGAIACASDTQCLLPPAGNTHSCTIQGATPTATTQQCTWRGLATAKESCAAWDDCGGFWCDDGTCWARSVAALGPSGVPPPFVAGGDGGAVSWVKVNSTASPSRLQDLRSRVESALAAADPDPNPPTSTSLKAQGLHVWDLASSSDSFPGTTVQLGAASIKFAPDTGAIIGFTTSRNWSSPSMPLGLLRHASHDEAQCNSFRDEYNLRHCSTDCGGCGFSKCNLGGNSTTSYILDPVVTAAYTDFDSSKHWTKGAPNPTTFWFNYSFPTPVRGAAPAVAALTVRINASSASSVSRGYEHRRNSEDIEYAIDFDVQWWGKPSTREAESMWFSISPMVGVGADADTNWVLDKLGRWVDPATTVVNGSRAMHHVWSGVRHLRTPTVDASDWDVSVKTMDAGLVAPSTPTLSPTGAFNLGVDGEAHPGTGGLHFNLFNNAWSTNYALFSVDSAQRFRWTVTLRD